MLDLVAGGETEFLAVGRLRHLLAGSHRGVDDTLLVPLLFGLDVGVDVDAAGLVVVLARPPVGRDRVSAVVAGAVPGITAPVALASVRRAARDVALGLDEFGGDLVEEARRRVVLRRPEELTAPCVRHVEPSHRPGDPDVGESAFLLHLVWLGERTDVGEHALLDADEEHDRELEALRRVQSHQDDLVVVVELIGVGDERHLLHELVDDGELPGGPDEFAEVLDAGVRLDRVFRLQLGQVARALECQLEHVAGSVRVIGGGGREPVDQLDELADAAQGLAGHAGLLATPQRLDERDALRRGECVELVDARIADPALGGVQDPFHRHLVGRVERRPKVRHHVLHLAPVVEPGSPDDLVRDTDPHERLFEHAALRVRPVQDRDVTPVEGLVVLQLLGRRRDEGGLVALVFGVIAHDPFARPDVGPQRLGLAFLVVVDDRIRRVEDRLRAAVVLVEHDRRHVGERLLELHDVAEVGPTESVDRLVRVADHADVLVPTGQLQDDLVLRLVRVLVFVDEDVAEALAVVLQDVAVIVEQLDDVHQQIVEVHRPGLEQPRLVLGVDLGVLAVEDVRRLHRHRLGAHELVLLQRDDPVHTARSEALRVETEIADDVGGQSVGVGRVVDRELAWISDRLGVRPEDPHARRVERGHPHRAHHRSDEFAHAVAHLRGGLVGERDGEDLGGFDAEVDEVGDAVGEDPGLAGPCTGDDEERTVLVHHGVELIGVEALGER